MMALFLASFTDCFFILWKSTVQSSEQGTSQHPTRTSQSEEGCTELHVHIDISVESGSSVGSVITLVAARCGRCQSVAVGVRVWC